MANVHISYDYKVIAWVNISIYGLVIAWVNMPMWGYCLSEYVHVRSLLNMSNVHITLFLEWIGPYVVIAPKLSRLLE